MSPTIRHKYKYFHSAFQRATDRQQKFHFCRLPFDVRPCNVKLNLSTIINRHGQNIENYRTDNTSTSAKEQVNVMQNKSVLLETRRFNVKFVKS